MWQRYRSAAGSIDRTVARCMGHLGEFVSHFPIRTLILSVFASIILAIGLYRIGELTESDGDKLWVPQNSASKDHQKYLDKWLGRSDKFMQVLFEAKDGGNAVTVDATREMFAAVESMQAVSVNADGRSWTLADLCWRDSSGRCRLTGYLKFFDADRAQFESVANGNNTALLVAVSSDHYPDNSTVQQRAVFSEPEFGPNGGLVGAIAVQQTWQMAPDADGDIIDKWGKAVEDVFLKKGPGSVDEELATTSIYFLHPNSVDEAIGESVGGDIPLVIIAFIVITAFSILAISKLDLIMTRTTLAMLGVFSVLLSIGAGFGLSLYAGIPFTSLSQVLPFILLGIGVDDMFVLVRAMDEVDLTQPELPLPARMRECLRTGGMSITITSLTNVAAFGFGSISSIPAIRWFCWYAAICIAMDWTLQVTFFMACFALTERRIAAGRRDFICCGAPSNAFDAPAAPPADAHTNPAPPRASSSADDCLWQAPPDPALPMHKTESNLVSNPSAMEYSNDGNAAEADTKHAPAQKPAGGARADSSRRSGGCCPALKQHSLLSGHPDSPLQVLLQRFYLPVLFHPVSMALVIVGFLGTAGFGIYCATDLREGLPLKDLTPDGHYVQNFEAANDRLFSTEAGPTTRLYFRKMDQSSPDVQARMLAAWRALRTEYSYFDDEASPDTNWLTAMHEYVANTAPQDANPDGTIAQASFYEHLNAFLELKPVWKDYIADAGKGVSQIEVSFFRVAHTPDSGDGAYERKVLTQVRDAEGDLMDEFFSDEADAAGTDVLFIFNDSYIYWETDVVIFRELLLNLGLALVGITIINLPLLVHPGAVILVIGCILLVDALLFAEMWVLDIPLNSVSVVNMVMAVGLAVDYVVHVVHKFLGVRSDELRGGGGGIGAIANAAVQKGGVVQTVGGLPLDGYGGGGRRLRSAAAMAEIGSAVLIGVVSTMLGVVALSGASSTIFRTFFALLFGTVLFGGLVRALFHSGW